MITQGREGTCEEIGKTERRTVLVWLLRQGFERN